MSDITKPTDVVIYGVLDASGSMRPKLNSYVFHYAL